MIYLIKMAMRNIKRNRRRSLLAVSSVMLSLALVMFLSGMVVGLTRSVVKNSTKNETGHILITTKSFQDKKRFMPVDKYIKNPKVIEDLIMKDAKVGKEIEDFNERILFGILLQYEGRNKPVIAMAGDPEKEKNYLMLNKSIVEGAYLTEHSKGRGHAILIGKRVADTLKIGVGDTMTVLVQGADYSPHIPTLKVKGIFQTGLNMMDDQVFQMNIDNARKILGMKKGAQQIMIFLKDYRKADKIAPLIKGILNNAGLKQQLSVVPWSEAGGYAATIATMGATYNMLYFIVVLLGAIIITNIMTMVVMERRKEIGIIKSMGFSKREVMLLFFMEGTILGTIGTVLGIISGFILSLYFVINGIDFSSSVGQMNMPMDGIIHVVFTVSGVVSVMFIGILVASVVSVFPAWRAAKMNVVDAIKSV